MIRFALILFCFISYPAFSSAAVSVTEVAWMGDSVSANNEWIELYNSGSSVIDVTGWSLSDSANLSIVLAGSISAGEYVLLERNRSSEAYLVKPPFLVYTGALVNTGATLVLRQADNSIADQVSGGANWETIGGNNTTKETAQYTSQGWITATPTPGKIATGVVPDPDTEAEEDEIEDTGDTNDSENETDTSASKTSNSSETVRLELSPVTLDVVVDVQSVAYVNQPVVMTATPQDISRSLIPSLQYEWNFGDLATGHGQISTHVYRYPGKYVVTLYASYNRQVSLTRHEITILPVSMSVTRNESGDIQINNDSLYDVDVSGYQLQGTKNVIFPPRSIMLPRSTVTIPWSEVLSYQSQNLVVVDAGGAIIVPGYAVAENFVLSGAVAVRDISSETIQTEPLVFAPPELVVANVVSKEVDPNFTFAESGRSEAGGGATTKIITTSQLPSPGTSGSIRAFSTTNASATDVSAANAAGDNTAPIFAFALILLLAVGSLFLPRAAFVNDGKTLP